MGLIFDKDKKNDEKKQDEKPKVEEGKKTFVASCKVSVTAKDQESAKDILKDCIRDGAVECGELKEE